MLLQVTLEPEGDELVVTVWSSTAHDEFRIGKDELESGVSKKVRLEEPDYTKGRRPPGKSVRRRSQRQERSMAEAVGGRPQPGSGNQPGAKGDVRKVGVLRIESKFTSKRSYRVERSTLDKIRGEASFGEVPALDIEFQDHNGRPEDRWVLVPFEIWKKQYATSDD